MPKETIVVEHKKTNLQQKPISPKLRIEEITKPESDVAYSFRKFKNLLRWSTVKEALGFVSTEMEAETRAKVSAVEAFMNGIDVYFDKDVKSNDNAVEKFLIANRLYDKAIEHAGKIGPGRLDEIKVKGFIKFIGGHKRTIKEMLRQAGDEKVKEIEAEMALHGGEPISAGKKKTFRDMIREEKTDGGMWWIMSGALVGVTAVGLVLADHFDGTSHLWLARAFDVGSILTTGWAADRALAGRRLINRAQLWTKVYLGKYSEDEKSGSTEVVTKSVSGIVTPSVTGK